MKHLGALSLAAVISPGSLGSSQNDWSPTGLASATGLRVSASVNINITGLATGDEGRVLIVHNVSAFVVTLISQSASSTAANRFNIVRDIPIPAGGMVILVYDASGTRWRLHNDNVAGRQITVSSSAASGGNDGDIWFQV